MLSQQELKDRLDDCEHSNNVLSEEKKELTITLEEMCNLFDEIADHISDKKELLWFKARFDEIFNDKIKGII